MTNAEKAELKEMLKAGMIDQAYYDEMTNEGTSAGYDLPVTPANLTAVRRALDELTTAINAQAERKKMGIDRGRDFHLIFTGKDGTDKVGVARMMSHHFMYYDLLPTEKVIEVNRADLVAEFVGQTAMKTMNMCDKAMGGILFIDEANELCRGDSDTFGMEAINALLRRMEDDRGKFVVIMAGSPQNMDALVNRLPGIPSRFNWTLHLENYTPSEIFGDINKEEAVSAQPVAVASVDDLEKRFGEAKDYYFNRQLVEAASVLKALCEEGYVPAQQLLGDFYLNGFGVDKDEAEAIILYTKAAEQGNYAAQYRLGECYHHGDGVTQDYAEAAKWYRKVAERGDDRAQLTLARFYEDGQGVAQDYAKAAEWYRKVAEQGGGFARLELERLKAEGKI